MNEFLRAMADHGLEVKPAREASRVRGWLSTGNYALNWAISGRFLRGYPLGHVVEIFGDPSTGKSLLVTRALAEAQQAGGVGLLDDTEGAFNPVWAERTLGIDPDGLGVWHSDTVEEHHTLATTFLRAVRGSGGGGPYALALDSLALLTTRHEQEVGLEKVSMDRAKKIHAMLRLIGRDISDLPVVYIVANHVYESLNPWEGRKTPGGKGIGYQSSVRLDLRTPKKVSVNKVKTVTGVTIRAVVAKNRIAPPFREVSFVIPFEEPISPYGGLISAMVDADVIQVTGRGNVIWQDMDTKIRAFKNEVRQEESARALVEKFPDILAMADAMLDAL